MNSMEVCCTQRIGRHHKANNKFKGCVKHKQQHYCQAQQLSMYVPRKSGTFAGCWVIGADVMTGLTCDLQHNAC